MSDDVELMSRVLLALQELDRSFTNVATSLQTLCARVTALELAQPPKAETTTPSA